MYKKSHLLFTSFLLIAILTKNTYAITNNISILSRSEWGADELLRYKDSPSWDAYYEKLKTSETKAETESQIKQREETKAINDHLLNSFPIENSLVSSINEENGHTLVWPIQKTSYVKSIVIHHTDTSTEIGSLDAIKSIYHYHTLSKGWGDIGYNYLIGYNGEIFEGRAGGDYTVGAHALRNNRSSVGIALIGSYETDGINERQYQSLKKLTIYLATKYGIDTNTEVTYHKNCSENDCKFYIDDYTEEGLVGHRDVGDTTCPGDKLHEQIQNLKSELDIYTKGFTYKKNNSLVLKKTNPKLDTLSEYDLLRLLAQVDYKIDSNTDKRLGAIRTMILQSIEAKAKKVTSTKDSSYDNINKITVKLSYPLGDIISIKKENKQYDIQVSSGQLLVNNLLVMERATIRANTGSYLEISSWERKPSWDTEDRYNDNTFRGDVIISVKDGKLQVLNRLLLSDYLKGLGEVSDGDDKEKIKTIIIAARTYARWYMSKAKKFPGEEYDASDNPDEFQKYLGYGLEKRSPKINALVDETEDEIITYNNDIIKPWYFSQSSGKTLNFQDYCTKNEISCKNISYPFLTSVFDPGSVGKEQLGHGVGISGAGASFLAEKGWTSEMIIKYFLKGVELSKL